MVDVLLIFAELWIVKRMPLSPLEKQVPNAESAVIENSEKKRETVKPLIMGLITVPMHPK